MEKWRESRGEIVIAERDKVRDVQIKSVDNVMGHLGTSDIDYFK